ncbi:MAG: MFS transporter [Candidatus Lokiarchaeota archaeon]|nr:MFS transporter [Candidatus Lokiarchaeota archaeon]
MKWKRSRARQEQLATPQVTADFDAMISIVSWNSTGFFFTEFLIPYAGVSLGGSGLGIGILFSFIVLGSAISSIIVGYLADRMRKTTLILVGAVGRGASYLVMYAGVLAGSLAIVGTGTFILGMLVAFYWVPFDALVSSKSCKDNRSYAFGRRHAAMAKGQLAGGTVGVTIFILANELAPGVDALVFSPMLIYFATNVIGGLLFKRRVDEHLAYHAREALVVDGATAPDLPGKGQCQVPREQGAPATGKPSNSANARAGAPAGPSGRSTTANTGKGFLLGFAMLLASYFLSSMNGMMAKPFLQVYLLRVITDNPTFVLLAYAPAGIVSMLAAPGLGRLADRMSPYAGIAMFSMLGAISTLVIINVDNMFAFAAILIIDMVLGNATGLVLSNIFSRISITHRGKVIGAGSAANNLGGALGPILGGMLVDSRGIVMPFIASIFVEISLVAPFVFAIKTLKPSFAESLARPAGNGTTSSNDKV